MSCYDGKGRVRRLERIQEKWVPVFRPNARQNKDLEHVSDFIFCECALAARLFQQLAVHCVLEKGFKFWIVAVNAKCRHDGA